MRSLREIRRSSSAIQSCLTRSSAALHVLRSASKSALYSPRNAHNFVLPKAVPPQLQQRRLLASSSPQKAPNDEEDPSQQAAATGTQEEPPLSKLSTAYLTLPNVITVARMASAPAIGYLIVADKPLLACAATLVAAATDWVDGFLAKKYNMQSVLGTFLDPLADKVVVSSLVIALAIRGALPTWLVSLILTRDVALVVAAVGLRWYLKPKGAGFWDTSTATFKITPNWISKLNTFLQFGLISSCLLEAAVGMPPVAVIEPLGYLVGATTLASGLSYIDGSGLLQFKKLKEARKKNQQ